MAKVQIKSEKLTPFGGFFPIMEPSPHTLSSAHPSRILFLQLNQFSCKRVRDATLLSIFQFFTFAARI